MEINNRNWFTENPYETNNWIKEQKLKKKSKNSMKKQHLNQLKKIRRMKNCTNISFNSIMEINSSNLSTEN